MPGVNHFILIDDDPVNNIICKMTIELLLGKCHINSFVNAEEGLNFIRYEYGAAENKSPAVLLLDINMPVMSGWEFLELFDQLSNQIKRYIKVYILSSSIDERDRERSYANKNVQDFLVKPLSKDAIDAIVKKMAIP